MVKIRSIETIRVALPTRRTHKWTGITEPIGGYVLVRMEGDDGKVGWGEAPVLEDWGGDHGRYCGETPETTKHMIERYLAPAVEGADAGNFVELHGRMDAIIKGYPYAKGTSTWPRTTSSAAAAGCRSTAFSADGRVRGSW